MFVFGYDYWFGFFMMEMVVERSFNDNFGEDGVVVEFNGEVVVDGVESGVMVVGGELGVFNVFDFFVKRFD